MAKDKQVQMHEISLKNKLERELGVEGINMKKDSVQSPNFTLTFPVPEKDMAGRSRVEKVIEDFYSKQASGKGFDVETIEGGLIAKGDNEAYLIGIVRDTPYCPDKYSIRVAKTDKPVNYFTKIKNNLFSFSS